MSTATATKTASNPIARAGIVNPCTFVSFHDCVIDDDGNHRVEVLAGRCEVCGEGLRYVVTLRDAAGRVFAAGCDCAKLAKMSAADLATTMRTRKQAAADAKTEREQPGFLAERAAKRAASKLADQARREARVSDLTAELAKTRAKLAQPGQREDIAARYPEFVVLFDEQQEALPAKIAELVEQLAYATEWAAR